MCDIYSAVAKSLELAGDCMGDPTLAVYERLIAIRPEFEALFVLDSDFSVRGEMLSRVFEMVLDVANDGELVEPLLQAEFYNHCGYGVPPEQFLLMFDVVRDEIKQRLGSLWTSEMDFAWNGVLTRLRTLHADFDAT